MIKVLLHLLLSVIRPNIEHGSDVREGNKSQSGSFGIHKLDGAKHNLGSSKTCNEAVRGTCALTHCRSNRSDRAKLKW